MNALIKGLGGAYSSLSPPHHKRVQQDVPAMKQKGSLHQIPNLLAACSWTLLSSKSVGNNVQLFICCYSSRSSRVHRAWVHAYDDCVRVCITGSLHIEDTGDIIYKAILVFPCHPN